MLKEIKTKRAVIDVCNALFELGILKNTSEVPPPHQNLRDDLGMDSQELVSLAADLSSLSIGHRPLHEAEINTINDLVAYLDAGRDSWLPIDTQYVLQGSTVINKNIETVFSYIANYIMWPEILQHVAHIDPEVDEGRLQSFRMHIKEAISDDTYCVRSWRYINEDVRIIDFSQITPPAGFRSHRGGWRFMKLSNTQTKLISYHGFDLNDGIDVDDSIKLIRRHIQMALRGWAQHGNADE